jgi:hypothetical protein
MKGFSLIRTLLAQHCRSEREYYLSPAQRWLYALKAIICLLLNRWDCCGKLDYLDSVSVAYTGGGVYAPPSEPTVHWFEELRVGEGLRRWCVFIDSDSD